jgi:putative membrane protein
MLNMLAFVVKLDQLLEVIVTTLIFVFIGLLFFALAFGILGKATPFSIRKEIEEDHNLALGIVIGSIMLGIALIIAAAING